MSLLARIKRIENWISILFGRTAGGGSDALARAVLANHAEFDIPWGGGATSHIFDLGSFTQVATTTMAKITFIMAYSGTNGDTARFDLVRDRLTTPVTIFTATPHNITGPGKTVATFVTYDTVAPGSTHTYSAIATELDGNNFALAEAAVVLENTLP